MAADVLIETDGDRIAAVTAGVPAPTGAEQLRGLTLPGLVNTHSHVFHRAIRGHGQSGVTTFWAWRDLMYRVAGRLDPDTLYRLARATYAEMALAGITSVGEFHYLHHSPGGLPYDDPNATANAAIRAANDAGIRITLLDTCYLQSDIDGAPLEGVQQRFNDRDWELWAARVDGLADAPGVRVGAAIHSVRAVPRAAMTGVQEYARSRGIPLHVHLSEQPAENTACSKAYGCSPTQLLDGAGVWGPCTTAVHATHLTDGDIRLLGASRTSISMCCTTERDLADGVGPAARLSQAGSPLCVGSDAHVIIDLLEEARAIELGQRLVTGTRGHLSAAELASAATQSGAVSIGWNAGRIVPGSHADLTTLSLETPRTAGARAGDVLSHVVFAATASDVTNVVVGGRPIVQEGQHRLISNPSAELEAAITEVLM